MASQTSDVRGQLSALSTVSEYLRNHVFDGSFDNSGIGCEAVMHERLKNIAVLLALAPKETVFVTLQNRLKRDAGGLQYGLLAVMEKSDEDDDNMIELSKPYIAPILYARHMTTMSSSSRGRLQHVEIIEHLLLAIHDSWNTMKNRQMNQDFSDLCEVFFGYTLGRTFAEFRHRLEFGREESAFIEFFDGPPPTVVTMKLAGLGIDKFDRHGKRIGVVDRWIRISQNLKREVDAFEGDLELTQDELDVDFQELARIRSIPGNAYTTVANGLVSTKVIALVHIIIRFRLGRMLRVFEILEEYHLKDGTMQLPWQTGAPATPPPHTLQAELSNAVTNLTDLLAAYQHYLFVSDPGCKVHDLPDVFPTRRSSTLSLDDEVGQNQYERNRNDDDNYDDLRHLAWGSSITTWLHGLCYHYCSANSLIRYAKRVSKSELEKSRIVLKLLPKMPEVATYDIDFLLVLTSSLHGPRIPEPAQTKYDRITEALSEISHDDEDFASCVDNGFLSSRSFGARFFFEMVNSTVLPPERRDMKAPSKDEKYKRKLNSHIRHTYPKIACNRAIPMVTAILLDELLLEYYGSIVLQKGTPHEHGILSGLECWKKIFATALPEEVNDDVAERVLAKLRRDFRRRLSQMGVKNLKLWIAFATGKIDRMPGEQEEDGCTGGSDVEEMHGLEEGEGYSSSGVEGEDEVDIDLGDDIPDVTPQTIAAPVRSTEEDDLWAAGVEDRIQRQKTVDAAEMEMDVEEGVFNFEAHDKELEQDDVCME